MINIAGLHSFSTVDWPGKLVATLFLQGCPLRCGYCHNFEILDPNKKGDVSWEKVMALLEKRHSLLDGVVFSGGEPLMQSELIDHVKQVKDMGFLAGLHTSGAYPERFKQLLPHLDWVGFDIKAPFDTPPAGSNDAWASKYDEVTYTKNSEAGPKKSLDLLLASGIDYQTRTTFDPTTLSRDDLAKIDTYLAERGAQKNVVQEVRTIGVNPEYQERYKRHKAH